QSHVLDVAEFVFQALQVLAQDHVRSPAAATDQDSFAIDGEEKVAVVDELGGNFPDAEVGIGLVGNSSAYLEFHVQRIEIGGTHLRRPPQARTGKCKLGKLLRLKGYIPRLTRAEFDLLGKFRFFDVPFQYAFDRLVGSILHLHDYSQLRAVIGWRIDLRNYRGIAQCDRPAGSQVDVTPEAHVFVGRRRIPIHEGDCQVAFGWRKRLDRNHVFGARMRDSADIKFISAPRAPDLFEVGDFLAVDPDVGPVVDPLKVQPNRLAPVAGRQPKGLAIPPRNRKRAIGLHRKVREVRANRVTDPGDLSQVHPERWVGIDLVLHQRRHHRRRHSHAVPIFWLIWDARDDFTPIRHLAGGLEAPASFQS